MKYRILFFVFCLFMLISGNAFAQDGDTSKASPLSFDLDEEKLSIDADIPSVDLILSFREMQERNPDKHLSFLNEIVDAAKHDPF